MLLSSRKATISCCDVSEYVVPCISRTTVGNTVIQVEPGDWANPAAYSEGGRKPHCHIPLLCALHVAAVKNTVRLTIIRIAFMNDLSLWPAASLSFKKEQGVS